MLIFMGPPGVGKGTFARMLCAHHKYNYIETGEILRAAGRRTPTIAARLARGELMPDSQLYPLLSDKIDTRHNMLLDGFPRTLPQAKWLTTNYADIFDMHVIYLDLPTDLIPGRIAKRRREGVNRSDDISMDIIQHRIDTFFKTTMPAIEWMRTAPNVKFSRVCAIGSADENFAEIMTALQEQKNKKLKPKGK